MKHVVLGAVLCIAAGCKYNRETVPVARSSAELRVPNQQRVLALAADQAVEALDLSKLQGKSVAIELTGVFPHSQEDLFGYLRAQVEAKAARAGAHVVAQPPVLVVPSAEGTAARPAAGVASLGTLTLGDPPDFRLLVNVSWGGADIRDKMTTDEPLLTKQIGLAVGGFISGLLLNTLSDSDFRKTCATVQMVGSVAGAGAWYLKKSPFPHVITVIGRVRVVAQGVPTRDGVAFMTEGSGESKIVNDERSPEGYMVVR